jgi:uncharacterized protein YbcI
MTATKSEPASAQARADAEDQVVAERGGMLSEVSNAIVQIHKQFYGKGPTLARAHLTRDLLAVVLEGGFTRGEQTLNERGHARDVVLSRMAMQESVQREFRDAIERIVGRSVRSFMSANDPVAGLQAELFILHPVGAEREHSAGLEREFAESSPSSSEAAHELAERASRARERHHSVLEEHRALRAEQQQARKLVHEERERLDEGEHLDDGI